MTEWIVTSEESGSKLLGFLKIKLGEDFSTKQIKRAIEDNRCTINQTRERFSTTLLGTGDRIRLEIDLKSAQSTTLFFEKNRILYEDDALFIYNKPPGITSDEPNFLKALRLYCPSLILIHRLDRDTSGALIFAKSASLQAKLIALFKEHLVKKGYLALVDGVPKKNNGKIDNYLGEKHRHQGQVHWGEVNQGEGLRAITEWKCLHKGADATLLACTPKTGRTHQIRVHLSEMGHPILGDFQYGKKFRCAYNPPRHLLHAITLNFPHPCTQEEIRVNAPLPEDFLSAIKNCIGANVNYEL